MFTSAYRAIMRQAWRRGVAGGSQLWLGVGAVALGARVARRLLTPRPAVVRENLRPGESLLITHFSEPS